VSRIIAIEERRPSDTSVPFIGSESDVTERFEKALEDIGSGVKARRPSYDDIGDAPVCVLFRYKE